MQRFTELKVWQRSHSLVLEVYRLTSKFPSDERFGLTSQLRRAVVSVPDQHRRKLEKADESRLREVSEHRGRLLGRE